MCVDVCCSILSIELYRVMTFIGMTSCDPHSMIYNHFMFCPEKKKEEESHHRFETIVVNYN